MWRLTRYLFMFASGQAFEAWLTTRLQRPSYAQIGEQIGRRLDGFAEKLAELFPDERDA